MWYNDFCHAEQITRALCLSKAAELLSQSNIAGKAPFMNVWTHVLAVPRDNGSNIRGGRFAMIKINEIELAWLSGIMEGEASFTWSTIVKNRPNIYGYPTVKVGMTDLDIVQKIQTLLGGNIRIEPPVQEHYKKQYRLQWSGDKATEIMGLLLPHMGIRRSEAICFCIEHWNSRTRRRTGWLNIHAKLHPDQVKEIRNRWANGDIKQRELAKEFGVTRGLIGQIIRGEVWKKV